jgi:hypothetical protein
LLPQQEIPLQPVSPKYGTGSPNVTVTTIVNVTVVNKPEKIAVSIGVTSGVMIAMIAMIAF